MYIDKHGQPWDCREEARIADRALHRDRTERAIDAAGIRAELDAAEANHREMVARQAAAMADATRGLSGNAKRRAAMAVAAEYKELLDLSSHRIGNMREAARALAWPK